MVFRLSSPQEDSFATHHIPITLPAIEEQEQQKEREVIQAETDEELELPIDIFYQGNKVVIKAPIIGVGPEGVSITINNNILTIHKETQSESKEETGEYVIRECHWGAISRSVELPVTVNPDKAWAKLEEGILTIVLPRLKSNLTRIIKIKSQ